ncbi:MAG: RNA methyltransferase [Bdellovibrionales bacterium]|nr:RNA methyltransferase [Bdellovibrionales bacterium]
MNCFLIYPDEVVGNKAVIYGERAKELFKRHKLSTGISLKAGIFNSDLGTAKVLKVGEILELEFIPKHSPPKRLPVCLLCGLSRPQTVKKIIQSAVLFGIEELHFVKTEFGEKSYLDSKLLQQENIQREIELGLEQAVDTIPPKIYIHRDFESFINEKIDTLIKNYQNCFFADTQNTDCVQVSKSSNKFLIAIGPEPGWSSKEKTSFLTKNFKAVSLGERILRTETASSALLGIIQSNFS